MNPSPSAQNPISQPLKKAIYPFIIRTLFEKPGLWERECVQLGTGSLGNTGEEYAKWSALESVTNPKVVSFAAVMHLSMVCPRMGGSGKPREFDFVRRTWVGILTSQRSPGWEIWLNRHLEKSRGSGNEWRVGAPSNLWKYPEFVWASFPRLRMSTMA